MQDGLTVLANSERADEDRTALSLTQLAFWLLAATDRQRGCRRLGMHDSHGRCVRSRR
jgi:hypothetical protein